MERFQFNTVVSATMKLLNTIDLFLQQSNGNQKPFEKKDKLIQEYIIQIENLRMNLECKTPKIIRSMDLDGLDLANENSPKF